MTLKISNIRTIRYWTARLSASDPGFIRLQFALKVVLTVASACLVMFFIIRLGAYLNLTPVMLTGLVGLQANVIVNDTTTRAKKITTCLFPISSVISVTLAAVFSIIGYHLPDIMLLVIVFLTFYVQRFGIRYLSFGMMGFLAFYFSIMYMHGIKFSQLPWYYAAILVGTACAYIVNFFLFKEQPRKVLKRSMFSYHIQTNVTLDLVIDMIGDLNSSAGRVKNLTRNIAKLNEYARMVTGQFESTDPGEVWRGIQTNELRLYVFDTAMLIETLSPTVKKLKDLHALEKSVVRHWLLQLVQSLRDAEVLREETDSSSLEKVQQTIEKFRGELDLLKAVEPDFKDWLYLLRRIESIANHVVDDAKTIQQKRLEHLMLDKNQEKFPKEREKPGTSEKTDEEDNGSEDAKEKHKSHGLRLSTQKGLQAVLVSGVAIVIGHFLSPNYPYWAVLAAILVIFGTESTGRTVAKASQRFAGTFFGAIVGFLIGHLVAGHTYFAMLLLAGCIFMAYYLMSLSYALFIFWVTMLLAMTFDLLRGGITEQVLLSRVLDTLIGAGLSATAAIFLFPHKTTDKIRNSMIEFLSDLKKYVDTYLNKFVDAQAVDALADKALNLDKRLQQLKNDADIIKRWPGNLARSGIENRLTVLTAVNYYAKHLVASTNRGQRLKIDDGVKQTLKHVETYFDKNVDILCQLLNEHSKGDLKVWELTRERELIERAPDEQGVENLTQTQLIHDLDYVWSINQAITELAIDLGAHV